MASYVWENPDRLAHVWIWMNRSTQPSLTRNLSPLVTPFTFGLTTPFYILTSNPNRHPHPTLTSP